MVYCMTEVDIDEHKRRRKANVHREREGKRRRKANVHREREGKRR
jgi:hypothetical protein